jgi:hypothetical protein
MEPRIQYAQTRDGVSIAFWTLGEGVPVVSLPPSAGYISRTGARWCRRGFDEAVRLYEVRWRAGDQ